MAKREFLSVIARTTMVITIACGALAPSVTSRAAAGFEFKRTEFCATTFTVTNANDSGLGSLRQAISDLCADGTISFDGDYTILLTSQLTIGKNLTIDGVGHSVTVDGQHTARVFGVYSGYALTLNNLTVANGAGADGFGGGIQNLSSTIVVTNCTFSGNTSTYRGGGIYSEFGNTTVTNTTFSGNSATQVGGGLSNHGGPLAITNCTFSGNSTAPDSGGGLQDTFNVANVNNSLFANNTGGNCANVTSTGSYNLADDGSCGSGFTNSSSILLGALGTYGGKTPTFPILPGSSAIDGTTMNCPAADQRGVTRGTTCDVGAFESGGFTLTKTGGDNQSQIVNTAFDAPLTLTVAANEAGEPVDGGVVTFTGPASGAGTSPAVNSAVIASGAVAQAVTANATTGAYTVTAGASGATSVDFALTNLPAPSERAKNGGFETYLGASRIPAQWKALRFGLLDGKDRLIKKFGKASVKIAGAGTTLKTLTQKLTLSGAAEDAFVLSYWVKGSKLAAKGTCQVQVLLYDGDDLKSTQTLKSPALATYAWRRMTLKFTAPADYTRAVIKISFRKTSGTAWFDGLSLLR